MKKSKEVEGCLVVGNEILVIEENSKEELKKWLNEYQNIEANNS